MYLFRRKILPQLEVIMKKLTRLHNNLPASLHTMILTSENILISLSKPAKPLDTSQEKLLNKVLLQSQCLRTDKNRNSPKSHCAHPEKQ